MVAEKNAATEPAVLTAIHEKLDFIMKKNVVSDEDIQSLKKDIGTILDATKELTKTVADLVTAWEKWRKAGKF